MVWPSYTEFVQLSKKYNLIPVFKEIIIDCETPVSAFLKVVNKSKYSCLLESVESSEKWGRYSFISWDPKFIFKEKKGVITLECNGQVKKYVSNKNPLEELKKQLSKIKVPYIKNFPRFYGGAVGYVSYDFIRYLEKLPRISKDDLNLPDCTFFFTDNLIVFDHYTHKTKIIVYVKSSKNKKEAYNNSIKKISEIIKKIKETKPKIPPSKLPPQLKIQSNIEYRDFISKVKKIKKYIKNGDVIQTVISQRFTCQTNSHPFNIYRALRIINPSPYMYFLNLNNFCIIGSSPEVLVRKEGETAITKPIAGTRRRGLNEKEDIKLENELKDDEKEKAEHIMLVDLGRNDLGKVSEYSTVKISNFMNVEKYSHVMHLVTTVEAKLKNGNDAFDLFYACFPAGTVTGAPKIRAMEIIEELEPIQRGPYAGAVGYFSFTGNLDMAITIRTIIYKNKKVYIQAGAGIVADSIPRREYWETRSKAEALFSAIKLSYDISN